MSRLAAWDVELYFTDNWAVYPEVTGADMLLQTKAPT